MYLGYASLLGPALWRSGYDLSAHPPVAAWIYLGDVWRCDRLIRCRRLGGGALRASCGVRRVSEIARLKLQDEVDGLQMKLSQVLDGKADFMSEDNLRCEVLLSGPWGALPCVGRTGSQPM